MAAFLAHAVETELPHLNPNSAISSRTLGKLFNFVPLLSVK